MICICIIIKLRNLNQHTMGGNMCTGFTVPPFELSKSLFGYVFGQDNHQNKMDYSQGITCKSRQIQAAMADCVGQLMLSKKMYKDPNMKTDPVTLRSFTNQGNQVKCEYKRAYTLVNDHKSRMKYKIVDQQDSRPSQVFVKDDVLQYFGVFLCFLSQNTYLINEILLNQPNLYGIYCLQMNVQGEKQIVCIDDYILCSVNDKKPQFSQPIKGMYLWPLLLEKAWFKVKGNSAKKIQKNLPQAVFRSFLSYPLRKYELSLDDLELNEQIIKHNLQVLEKNKAYILTSKRQPAHKLGLSGQKHYYLMASFKVDGKILFYIRNPCGFFDFRGYNQHPSQQILEKIKIHTSQMTVGDGNFILDEDEFIEQIQSFFIYHYSKSSRVVSAQNISFKNNQQILIYLELKQDSQTSFSLTQTYPNNEIYKYCPITYQVINLSKKELVSGLTNQDGCFGVQETYMFENIYKRLPAGQYLIRLKKKARNQNRLKKQYSSLVNRIVATASTRIKFDYLRTEQRKIENYILVNKMFFDFLKKYGKKKLEERSNLSKKAREDVDHIVCWMGDLVFIYIQKTNLAKKEIRLEVSFPECQNLECLNYEIKGSYKSLDTFTDNQIILFQKVDLTEQTKLGKYVIEPF